MFVDSYASTDMGVWWNQDSSIFGTRWISWMRRTAKTETLVCASCHTSSCLGTETSADARAFCAVDLAAVTYANVAGLMLCLGRAENSVS